MAEALVLQCIIDHNRPFNVQCVADLLATKGVKKVQAQRCLDDLAAAGKLRCKVCACSYRAEHRKRGYMSYTYFINLMRQSRLAQHPGIRQEQDLLSKSSRRGLEQGGTTFCTRKFMSNVLSRFRFMACGENATEHCVSGTKRWYYSLKHGDFLMQELAISQSRITELTAKLAEDSKKIASKKKGLSSALYTIVRIE